MREASLRNVCVYIRHLIEKQIRNTNISIVWRVWSICPITGAGFDQFYTTSKEAASIYIYIYIYNIQDTLKSSFVISTSEHVHCRRQNTYASVLKHLYLNSQIHRAV